MPRNRWRLNTRRHDLLVRTYQSRPFRPRDQLWLQTHLETLPLTLFERRAKPVVRNWRHAQGWRGGSIASRHRSHLPPVIAVIGPLGLAGCARDGILTSAGPVAEANRWITLDALAIMLVIVVPTIVTAIAFAWWFRAGNARARRRPDFVFSGRIELVVWSIPIIVILFLGGVIWIGSHRLDPRAPLASARAPVDIEVVSLDWKWLFIHPAVGVASVNRLIIPAATPIRLHLTSGSVMNAFFVPQLGSMIYTMNGMESQLNLQADRPGTYRGVSAHYSGAGFPDMAFEVRALPPAAYAAWVANRQASAAPVLDAARYVALAQQGRASPGDYRGVQPGLFAAITTQQIGPAPGPPANVAQKDPQ